MRKAPSSSAAKTSSPFLIRIKEVPQIRERKIKINQATAGVPEVVFSTGWVCGEVLIGMRL